MVPLPGKRRSRIEILDHMSEILESMEKDVAEMAQMLRLIQIEGRTEEATEEEEEEGSQMEEQITEHMEEHRGEQISREKAAKRAPSEKDERRGKQTWRLWRLYRHRCAVRRLRRRTTRRWTPPLGIAGAGADCLAGTESMMGRGLRTSSDPWDRGGKSGCGEGSKRGLMNTSLEAVTGDQNDEDAGTGGSIEGKEGGGVDWNWLAGGKGGGSKRDLSYSLFMLLMDPLLGDLGLFLFLGHLQMYLGLYLSNTHGLALLLH